MKENRVVALAGQPNCGKSTIFNMLTGARQYVANYPGVTVDIKRGFLRSGAGAIEIVDLPGAYSLTQRDEAKRVVDWRSSGRVQSDVVFVGRDGNARFHPERRPGCRSQRH